MAYNLQNPPSAKVIYDDLIGFAQQNGISGVDGGILIIETAAHGEVTVSRAPGKDEFSVSHYQSYSPYIIFSESGDPSSRKPEDLLSARFAVDDVLKSSKNPANVRKHKLGYPPYNPSKSSQET